MTDVRARTSSGARNGLSFLLCGLGLALALLTASCGNNIFVVGTPVVTLSAEPGRFTSYIVAIDQIELTGNDGAVVVLPTLNERVDLAHLSSFANLLEAPAVPIGTYVSATFILDYSSPTPAYITVDSGGQAFPVSKLLDVTGAAPTTETVTVKFDPNNPLVINTNTSSLVAFDIDLEASNTITFTPTGVQVVVKPFWTVTSLPVYTKPVYARGLFVLADTSAGNFVMNVRPLQDVFNNPFGALTVIPSAQTYYNIDGVTYTGAAGLAALEALKGQTSTLQIAAYGTGSGVGNPFSSLSTITPSFNATAVYAGTSLESTVADQITGIVSAVSGNTLTVMGAAVVTRAGIYGFQQTATVSVGPATVVSEDGVAGVTLTLGSISVGQVINVSGQVPVDGAGNPIVPTVLDATGDSGANIPGHIRLQNTTLFGTLNSATTGSLSLNLLSVDHYEPTYLNFTGTGSSSALDATAASYTVNTGSIDESATAAGTLLKIDGMANGYGMGPPYFTATAITPASSLPSQLILEWTNNGSLNPFTVVNSSGIIVNLDDPGL
ncbi:MAG: hypothetical protein ACREU6_12860, partial [Steroidobacteraceae bacterium]